MRQQMWKDPENAARITVCAVVLEFAKIGAVLIIQMLLYVETFGINDYRYYFYEEGKPAWKSQIFIG